MSDNEYEERNRAAKAFRLVSFIEKKGLSVPDVESLDAPAWGLMARLAGTKPPSDRTKAIVLHVLRERSNG